MNVFFGTQLIKHTDDDDNFAWCSGNDILHVKQFVLVLYAAGSMYNTIN